MTEAIKTIPEIKAEAEAKIWAAVEPLLVERMEQYRIAEKLNVSTSWLSRYLKKNADKVQNHPKIPNWAYTCGQARRWY